MKSDQGPKLGGRRQAFLRLRSQVVSERVDNSRAGIFARVHTLRLGTVDEESPIRIVEPQLTSRCIAPGASPNMEQADPQGVSGSIVDDRNPLALSSSQDQHEASPPGLDRQFTDHHACVVVKASASSKNFREFPPPAIARWT